MPLNDTNRKPLKDKASLTNNPQNASSELVLSAVSLGEVMSTRL